MMKWLIRLFGGKIEEVQEPQEMQVPDNSVKLCKNCKWVKLATSYSDETHHYQFAKCTHSHAHIGKKAERIGIITSASDVSDEESMSLVGYIIPTPKPVGTWCTTERKFRHGPHLYGPEGRYYEPNAATAKKMFSKKAPPELKIVWMAETSGEISSTSDEKKSTKNAPINPF